jgi:uncharacterized cupredoxin-like copper-binding protein
VRYALLAAAALAVLAAPPRTNSPVTIIARDYAFDAPDTIPAGLTTIHFVNRGPELHHSMLVRLGEHHTAADFAKAMDAEGPPPSWITFVGGPNAPAPGGDATVTLNLAPGHYLLVCLVPGADGQPHAMKGMVRPLTVTLPNADVTVNLVDYGFDLSAPLKAGHRTIRVINTGSQAHEVELIRLKPGTTVAAPIHWMEHHDSPRPPADPLGGIAPISPGGEAEFTVDLTPGKYALVCFLPDAHDGKPHYAHGMTREVTVQ